MDWRVLKVLQIIRGTALHKPIRLVDLGAAVNLSGSRLRHLFLEEHRETLRFHLAKARLKRACELLDGTCLSVNEISADVGYARQSSLSRKFVEEYGLTPTEYRQRSRGGTVLGVRDD